MYNLLYKEAVMKTSDIVPLSECRKNLSRLIDRVNQTGAPVVVTTNGKPSMVMLSPENYDALMQQAQHARDIEAVRVGLRAADESRVSRAAEVMARIRRPAGKSARK